MAHFDVVGAIELSGDIMGSIMGTGEEVVGAVVRHPRTGQHRMLKLQPAGGPEPARGRALALPDRAPWREQLAPGVIQPDEGMVPLPLEPQAGSGTFTSTLFAITFQGQLQKPYRPERLLVSTARSTPAANIPRVLGQVFVGTDLQAAEITTFDLELIGNANSFGTRLTCKAAEPGVLVRILAQLSSALPTTTDTIFASMMWLGRIIH
jgi:hypothetical protein